MSECPEDGERDVDVRDDVRKEKRSVVATKWRQIATMVARTSIEGLHRKREASGTDKNARIALRGYFSITL